MEATQQASERQTLWVVESSFGIRISKALSVKQSEHSFWTRADGMGNRKVTPTRRTFGSFEEAKAYAVEICQRRVQKRQEALNAEVTRLDTLKLVTPDRADVFL